MTNIDITVLQIGIKTRYSELLQAHLDYWTNRVCNAKTNEEFEHCLIKQTSRIGELIKWA